MDSPGRVQYASSTPFPPRWRSFMTRPRSIAVLLLLLTVLVPNGSLSAERPETALEPEFRQLRAKLAAQPEFSGADAASKFRLAQELAHRGDVHGAIETYRAAIHLKPDWADPHRGLGQVLLDHHDYAEAAEMLQASVRLGRDDHQAYYWLGRAYMGKGAFAAAAVALEQSIRLNADDAEAYADLALVKMAEGDLPAAEAALRQSMKLKPDYAEAHQLRELLIQANGDEEKARSTGLARLRSVFQRE